MNDKIKSVLNSILEQFKSGDIPKAMSIVSFPTIDVPMNKWSMLNRLFCYPSKDCRGFKMWHEVNRNVKKGAKAVYILVPWIRKSEDKDDEDDLIPLGFLAKPVFRVEDTEGELLDYQKLSLPTFPLMERVEQLGLTIKAVPGNDVFLGRYTQTNDEILLATEEETTYFHELCHAVEKRLLGKLQGGQDPLQEIVAELGAATLCQMIGKDGSKYLGNNYMYIEHYATKLNITPHTACMKVLGRVEKALNFLLGKEVNNNV